MYARNQNFGVKVEHDDFGRVRRVGNVFINYDANDRIKRVGSVYMAYNRFALEQVGDYRFYNPRGQIVDIVGSVNGFKILNLSKLTAMTMTTSMETHEAAIIPTRYEETSSDQDQYYFKKVAQKRKLMILKLQEGC
jgi:hypothetical protein